MESLSSNNVWLFTHGDFIYAKCEAEFEMGILVYANGRTYSRPTIDTPACNTYNFRQRRVYTDEHTGSVYGSAPDWYTKWLAKNDMWNIYTLNKE